MFWTSSGDGLIENHSGMVLSCDGSMNLEVVDIDARQAAPVNWKWSFYNGKLVNRLFRLPLGRDPPSGAYFPGGGHYASVFKSVEPDMRAESASICAERAQLQNQALHSISYNMGSMLRVL